MNKKTVITLATSLIAGSVQAAVSQGSTTASANAAAAQSKASASEAAPSLLKRLSASYDATLFGGRITDPLAATMPDSEGVNDVSSPIYVKNYLSANYKINDNMKIGPVLYWKNYPKNYGKRMGELQDPYIKLGHSSLISKGGFNLAADIRAAAPVSVASQTGNLITYLRSKQIASYQLPQSRFSITNTTSVYQYIYSDTTGGKSLLNDLYEGLSLDYKVSSKITVGVLYEMDAVRSAGTSFWNYTNAGTDLEPNLSWDITPSINFNPFLDIKTGGKIKADTTQVGFNLSVKLL